MAETVTLQPITEEMIAELWSISYGPKADLEWKNGTDRISKTPC